MQEHLENPIQPAPDILRHACIQRYMLTKEGSLRISQANRPHFAPTTITQHTVQGSCKEHHRQHRKNDKNSLHGREPAFQDRRSS